MIKIGNCGFVSLDGEFVGFNCESGAMYNINSNEFSIVKKIKNGKSLNNSELKKYEKLFATLNKVQVNKAQGSFNVQWHINDNCNLRCKHCYMTDYAFEGLTLEKLKGIADNCISSIKILGFTPEFTLTGGEPLMNKNLFPLIKYITEKSPKSKISLLTNGTLITQKVIEIIKKGNIDVVQVSLESSNQIINDSIRGKSNFNTIVKSIKLLAKNGVSVNMHFVLSKKNMFDVINYIKFAKKIGARSVTISNLVPMGNGNQMRDKILSPSELKKTYSKIIKFILANKQFKNFINTNRPIWCNFNKGESHSIGGYCPIAFNTLTILADGTTLPCRRMDLKIGNLLEQNFFEIWYGSEILWNLRDQSKLVVCGNCEKLSDCGGCRALAHSFGNYMGPDPQCWKINKNLNDLKKLS